MTMNTAQNILETIHMIAEDRLDIRTVTMGISLLDCADSDSERARQRCYDRITSRAARLVEVASEIEAELGIPIINKRISVTPIALVAAACGETDLTSWAQMLDSAGKAVGVDFIGGFSALVDKGMTPADRALINSIPQALAGTDIVCSSVNIGSSRAGINMEAVARMGEIIVETAQTSKGGLGAAKLVVFANSVGDNPFMAGAFHGVEMPDCVVSVGVSGPGVIKRAIDDVAGRPFDDVAEAVKKAAFKVTRMGELVGRLAAQRLDVEFGIVDLSLAPTAEVGDSVARALEAMGLERVGAHGTTAALALLNDAVKKGGLMACSRVGGLSGSFIPVSEDEGMIEAAALGAISLEKLEAMTAICSVGLDMVAVPGDTPASSIAGMIADEAAIGVMNHKTTAVRIIPAPGTHEGDMVEFGGLLGKAPVMAVSPYSSEAFMRRGGIIPSPVHGFRN
ncbi:PFL family protein [Schaalia sp. lx-260]|uniref:PFL family protein n=1 Tax=Schaalia sp. lx-260 TaxID=2899082 RepID=UPI001E4F76D2|nr:PFL family protein [Schaalia sp. lx-260]MCD4548902.1 PFL family protein [Schaalia sp. lx-260]